MIEEIKKETKESSNQKSYYEFLHYLEEEYGDDKNLNDSIDFDDYSK